MTIFKKSSTALIAIAMMSTAFVPLSVTSANATHYGVYHGNSSYKPPKKCHWGWVKWQDSYGNWHRKWKHHCNHPHH